MSTGPEPLSAGTLIAGKFEVCHVLGRGGFGITYEVVDVRDSQPMVAKELAPVGTGRHGVARIDWAGLGPAESQRLRHQFMREARLLQQLHVKGVPQVRALAQDNDTVYYCSERIPNALTLASRMAQEGPLDEEFVRKLLTSVLSTLQELHHRGILHRDIKPSNILLTGDDVYLIDFGSAREWVADLTMVHTVQFTPGYAPIEQLSERGRRGPGTDLYALSATAYHMLTGRLPVAATARTAGEELPSLSNQRPDVSDSMVYAIEAGLRLRLEDRPHSAKLMLDLLVAVPGAIERRNRLELLDERLQLLQGLKVLPRQCPSCGELLEEPRALKSGVCPVCHEGTIVVRKLEDRACPNCRIGVLAPVSNRGPLAWCPACHFGRLHPKVKLAIRHKEYICASCGENWRFDGTASWRGDGGMAGTWEQLRQTSGRSASGWECPNCRAQFDDQPDGRRMQVQPRPGDWDSLYPDEWARIAAGLDPGAGNGTCQRCSADFYLEGRQLTLLDSPSDPFGFSSEYMGRLLSLDDVRWLGVGKGSGRAGLLCHRCGTEFDFEGRELRLEHSTDPNLIGHLGETHEMANWFRLARELPLVGHEHELDEELDDELVRAYVQGEFPFDSKLPDVIWRGSCEQLVESGEYLKAKGASNLTVNTTEVTIGGVFRKRSVRIADIVQCGASENILTIDLGHQEVLILRLHPVNWTVWIASGRRNVLLEAQHLAAALGRLIEG